MQRFLSVLLVLALLTTGVTAFAEGEAESDEPVFFGPFAATDLDGNPVTSEDYAESDLTIMLFWATWCGACKVQLVEFARMFEESDVNVRVMGVLTDAIDMQTGEIDPLALEDGRALLAATGADAATIVVPDEWLLGITYYVVQAFPTTFLVDRQGNLLGSQVGVLGAEEWLEVFDRFLPEDVDNAPAA